MDLKFSPPPFTRSNTVYVPAIADLKIMRLVEFCRTDVHKAYLSTIILFYGLAGAADTSFELEF